MGFKDWGLVGSGLETRGSGKGDWAFGPGFRVQKSEIKGSGWVMKDLGFRI